MVKALKVTLDGKLVGIYVPAAGELFCAALANVPKTYMRAQVISESATEHWHWQLPDIQEGPVLSFEMIDATEGSGEAPHSVTQIDPAEAEINEREAKKLYAKYKPKS